ncbi:hypothetical protein R1flu_003052 [Riccia fluitans]|uniref:Uncharacterized protein n=1 Tax=Riccia fluitans TaxID=41844 RepID=A0ABD1YBB8_9MARC
MTFIPIATWDGLESRVVLPGEGHPCAAFDLTICGAKLLVLRETPELRTTEVAIPIRQRSAHGPSRTKIAHYRGCPAKLGGPLGLQQNEASLGNIVIPPCHGQFFSS